MLDSNQRLSDTDFQRSDALPTELMESRFKSRLVLCIYQGLKPVSVLNQIATLQSLRI